MEKLYHLVRNHQHCTSAPLELGREPQTDDCESNVAVTTIPGRLSEVCWSSPHFDIIPIPHWFSDDSWRRALRRAVRRMAITTKPLMCFRGNLICASIHKRNILLTTETYVEILFPFFRWLDSTDRRTTCYLLFIHAHNSWKTNLMPTLVQGMYVSQRNSLRFANV